MNTRLWNLNQLSEIIYRQCGPLRQVGLYIQWKAGEPALLRSASVVQMVLRPIRPRIRYPTLLSDPTEWRELRWPTCQLRLVHVQPNLYVFEANKNETLAKTTFFVLRLPQFFAVPFALRLNGNRLTTQSPFFDCKKQKKESSFKHFLKNVQTILGISETMRQSKPASRSMFWRAS